MAFHTTKHYSKMVPTELILNISYEVNISNKNEIFK